MLDIHSQVTEILWEWKYRDIWEDYRFINWDETVYWEDGMFEEMVFSLRDCLYD